jgi:hypothetical protein
MVAEPLCADARRCSDVDFGIPIESSGTGSWKIFCRVPGASGRGRREFPGYKKSCIKLFIKAETKIYFLPHQTEIVLPGSL